MANEPEEGFESATDNIDEIELDTPNPDEEGDDSIHASIATNTTVPKDEIKRLNLVNTEAVAKLPVHKKAKPRKQLFVPFIKEYKFRDRGQALIGYKRALSRAKSPDGKGYLRWTKFIPFYGRTFRNAVRKFRKDHSLPANDKIDKAFHNALVKAKSKKGGPAFDAKAAWLIQQDKERWDEQQQANIRLKKEQLIRAKMQASMWFLIHNRGAIHYTQSALRMWGVRNRIKPPVVTRWEDCSSAITYICWLAGIPDPNGLAYSGYGFTGTMYDKGPRIPLFKAKPGDVNFYGVYFGYRGITHTTMMLEQVNGRWFCMSHGREAGPEYIPSEYREVLGTVNYVTQSIR